jgi:hypothetical protein
MGCNVFGKTTKKLGKPRRRTQVNEWIVAPDAFTPIVNPKTFRRVQAVLRGRDRHLSKPNDYYLDQLRRVLSRHGKITRRISARMGIRSHTTLMKRFGSMLRAYQLIAISHLLIFSKAPQVRLR